MMLLELGTAFVAAMGILLLGWFTKTYCASRKYECGSRNDRPCLRDRQGWEDDEVGTGRVEEVSQEEEEEGLGFRVTV